MVHSSIYLMGLILEKSKIAEDLLLSMGKLFGGWGEDLQIGSSRGGNSRSKHRNSWGKCSYDESNCSASYVKAQL